MFKDFIENLCEIEGLIDIGRFGIASQSSLSKWSKDNDAQRALSDINIGEYNFHTGNEDNSWWKVEFDNAECVEYIIINNRKNERYADLASDIVISAIDDSNNKIVLHKGVSFFGSLPRKIPLIISVNSKLNIKAIEILSPSKKYLHLSRIYILAKKGMSNPRLNSPVFYMNRTDGLGERLRALINSIILKKYNKGDFYFSWPVRSKGASVFHATSSAEKIFKHGFLESNFLEREDINNLNLTRLNNNISFSNKFMKSYDGILVNHNENMESIFKSLGLDFDKTYYKEAFDSIDFTEEIASARRLAREVNIDSKAVAIHLRSGDIVFGHIRLVHGFMDKVIPIYIVEALIKYFKELGYQIIIFGQDKPSCSIIKNKYRVLYSEDFMHKEFNETQKAIFDITLMSRCEKIFSGSSGFAILASWIGGATIESYSKYINREDVVKIFNQSASNGLLRCEDIHPYIRSFSFIHYINYYNDMIALTNRTYLLEQAICLDPNNVYSKLLLSLDLYHQNLFAEADKVLYEAISFDKSPNLGWAFKAILEKGIQFDGSIGILNNYVDNLKNISSKSLVALLAVYMYEERGKGDIDRDFYIENLKLSNEQDEGYGFIYRKLENIIKLL